MKATIKCSAKIFNMGVRPFNNAKLATYNDEHIQKQKNRDYVKHSLTLLGTSPEELKTHTDLPGVCLHSELPADPITRLFFQVKGDCALYQTSYEETMDKPKGDERNQYTIADPDRARFEKRSRLPIHDMAGRILEGQKRKKRFVTVPCTVETKGVAKIMEEHGLISGMRDFNNRHAFVVELKYFQGSGVIQYFEAVRSNFVNCDVEWSPLMIRKLASNNNYGNIRVVCVRTWDGRVLDQFQARREEVGGTGLCMIH